MTSVVDKRSPAESTKSSAVSSTKSSVDERKKSRLAKNKKLNIAATDQTVLSTKPPAYAESSSLLKRPNADGNHVYAGKPTTLRKKSTLTVLPGIEKQPNSGTSSQLPSLDGTVKPTASDTGADAVPPTIGIPVKREIFVREPDIASNLDDIKVVDEHTRENNTAGISKQKGRNDNVDGLEREAVKGVDSVVSHPPRVSAGSQRPGTDQLSKDSAIDLNAVSLSLKPSTILKSSAGGANNGIESAEYKPKKREKRVRIAVSEDDVQSRRGDHVVSTLATDAIAADRETRPTTPPTPAEGIEKPSREARRAARKLRREAKQRNKERKALSKDTAVAGEPTRVETTRDKLARARQTERDRMDVDLEISEEDDVEDIFMKAMKKYGITI